ncbi:MAG TPA: tetratricopeptide repeat protein [Terriglobales bacterium]|nr:tetratricopeptide repeat protein [Terriglobales bacterium]
MRALVGVVLFLGTFVACPAGAQDGGFEKQYQDAQRALAEGKIDEAQHAYENLRDANPGIAEIHANLGLIYFEQRKFDAAIPELRRALQLKPGLSNSAALLAMSLSELGRYEEALPGLEKGFRSTDPQIKRMCGLQLERVYTGLKRDNKAVDVAMDMNRLYPDDAEVLYHNGKIFGNYAFLTMRKLVEVAPNSIWRHQALAEAAESQQSFATAIAEYHQVLRMNPDQPGIHYRLGRTLLARSHQSNSSDDLAEAEKEFEQELKLDPKNGNAAYEIGLSRQNAGQFAEAQQIFEQVLEFHPDFEEAQLGLASVLTSQGKPQEALPHLQKAIALNGENEVSWYRLSQVERSLGNSAEAQQALAKFKVLHDRKMNEEGAGRRFVSDQGEVTPQSLGADAPQ